MDTTYTVWLIDDNGRDIMAVSRETHHPEADIKTEMTTAAQYGDTGITRKHFRVEED